MRDFRTEKPFVVATPSGGLVSTHYNKDETVASAKQGQHRLVFGRHRGDWKQLLEYKKGVLVWTPTQKSLSASSSP